MADSSRGSIGDACETARLHGAKGALISGGCDRTGAVPLPYEEVRRAGLIKGFPLNVHTGLISRVDEALLQVECVSLEIPPSDYTVRTVYGIRDGSRNAYIDALGLLIDAGVRTVPHLCMGIDGKGEHGEVETLGILESYVDHVVLLSMKRTPGQEHTNRLPTTQNCEIIIKEARERFKCLGLGCMRDRAPAKERLWHYFDTIAWPSSIIKDELARSERTCTTYDICCAV